MSQAPAYLDILDYWYSDRIRRHWFSSTPELDEEIRRRYEALWARAGRGELDAWLSTADGCLALIILMDQFPLNMFRGEARSFSTEARSIEVARQALDQGFDKLISADRLSFMYMPFMHSEQAEHQALAVRLFEASGLKSNLAFAKHHRDIISRFGRFPHRNHMLGRESTAEELAYLASDGAFRG